MSSAASPDPDPWAQFNSYTRDCSRGICSFYCPQWCPIIFPPPPNDDSHAALSPLVIALIAALSSAFLLLTYYTIMSKYCRRRRTSFGGDNNNDNNNDADLLVENQNHQQWQQQQSGSRGLDEALIKAITVCKYKKGDGLVEGTDCSVCLSEFREEESLRLLPKCNHAFHAFCIDAWLKAHSNCPLCRSNIAPLNSNPSPATATAETAAATAVALGPQNSPASNASSHHIQRPSEALVMVVEDLESAHREEIIVASFVAPMKSKNATEAHRRDEENEEREISENTIEIITVQEEEGSDSSSQHHHHRGLRSIADALRSDEDEDDDDDDADMQIGNCCRSSPIGIGSSMQVESNSRIPKHKGKDFIIPNREDYLF